MFRSRQGMKWAPPSAIYNFCNLCCFEDYHCYHVTIMSGLCRGLLRTIIRVTLLWTLSVLPRETPGACGGLNKKKPYCWCNCIWTMYYSGLHKETLPSNYCEVLWIHKVGVLLFWVLLCIPTKHFCFMVEPSWKSIGGFNPLSTVEFYLWWLGFCRVVGFLSSSWVTVG